MPGGAGKPRSAIFRRDPCRADSAECMPRPYAKPQLDGREGQLDALAPGGSTAVLPPDNLSHPQEDNRGAAARRPRGEAASRDARRAELAEALGGERDQGDALAPGGSTAVLPPDNLSHPQEDNRGAAARRPRGEAASRDARRAELARPWAASAIRATRSRPVAPPQSCRPTTSAIRRRTTAARQRGALAAKPHRATPAGPSLRGPGRRARSGRRARAIKRSG